jgi:hypothetical protein
MGETAPESMTSMLAIQLTSVAGIILIAFFAKYNGRRGWLKCQRPSVRGDLMDG